tara:strand:- start:91 stop:315 length:225 start_codon:yes stop_codon:yes gene_type:complete
MFISDSTIRSAKKKIIHPKTRFAEIFRLKAVNHVTLKVGVDFFCAAGNRKLDTTRRIPAKIHLNKVRFCKPKCT